MGGVLLPNRPAHFNSEDDSVTDPPAVATAFASGLATPAAPPPALALAEVLPGLAATLRPGEVEVLGPIAVPGLAARRVRIYLPRAWTPGGPPRFALYLFDGQNVFEDSPSFSGGWHAHETVEGLARTHHPTPVVIGIDHGGPRRIHELSPFAFEGEPGQLELLLDWMVGALMPGLATALNLVPGPFGTVVGGSSMGGLASLYGHFRHPEAFGGALVMSPSFWLARAGIFPWLAEQPTPPVSRIYLDCGTREGKGLLLAQIEAMADDLTARGYDSDHLLWRCDSRGAHNEKSWRRRLPKALRFIYR